MLGLSGRALAVGAGVVALGVDAVYLASVTLEEGGDPGARVALVAGSVALAGAAALAAAASSSPSLRLVLLAAAGVTLVFWGILGLLSIGVPLLVGALLAAAAAMRSAETAPPDAFRIAVAAAVGVAGALVIAFALT
ncbi:MAG TPA: hypothetical protein VLB86_12540 [Gaiellaceae bacterium]|nr:hypothetical protein [Gaiellaceae bacterium]